MKEFAPKPLDLLKKVISEDINRTELKHLIEYSYSIALSFLRSKFRRNLSPLKTELNNLEDIALDAIVPLFVKNRTDTLGLKTILDKWDFELQGHSDFNYALSKIIWKRVEQTVTQILKERDPIFGKILKTLNICIQKNDLVKIRYFGSVLIVKNNNKTVSGTVINYENFNLLPEEIFALKQINLINRIFEYILTETEYFPAIPFNLLIKRIKQYHINRYSVKFSNKETNSDNFVYNDLVSNALKTVKDKLINNYVLKEKLSLEESEIIYSSFNIISEDILNGGLKGSLFTYVNYVNSEIDQKKFYSDYHHIMNYLLKHFKNEVADKIIL